MTRAELDLLATSGCAVPGCTHEHDEPLCVHARCHPGAPQFLWKVGDRLEFLCVHPECMKLVLRLDGWRHLRAAGQWRHSNGGIAALFAAHCHPDSAVQCRYAAHSGVVEVACYQCGQVVASVGLE